MKIEIDNERENDFYNLLPEDISDTEAAHLADILMTLALAVEGHYYSQIVRHTKAQRKERQENEILF